MVTSHSMAHLYATGVGFSAGFWLVVTLSYIRHVGNLYPKPLWRLPLGLGLIVLGLGVYAMTIAVAIYLRSSVPTWRLILYWLALLLSDVGFGMIEWHLCRHGWPLTRRYQWRNR